MLAALVLVHASCSSRVDTLASTSSESTSGSSSTSTTSDTSTSTTGPITGADDATSYNIIDEPDLPSSFECDLWAQDCPPGEKCMPWANDGGNSWNGLRCSPVVDEPRQPGEPCTVEGSGVSGLDDCDLGSMCWDVDPETKMGVCVEQCQGSEGNPICSHPCEVCNIAGEAVIVLCLPNCDPLAQSCAEGEACYPAVDSFSCVPDVSGRDGIAGDTCEFINVCDPGLFCADARHLPACDGASCCTPFCNLEEPDDCNAHLPGTVCTPWFGSTQMYDACMASGTLGFCAAP
jgi:hypothetical protein